MSDKPSKSTLPPIAEIIKGMLFTAIILFFISPDSYTHLPFGRGDSAWFFLSGKAWMNGMTPYVDFSDSKGPLLWLIYGIGYLISPRSYHGVFWISVLFYYVTFLFTYKTIKLFLTKKYWAMGATAIMPLAYFNPLLHYEIRAEDFCLTFMVISLFLLCKTLYGREIPDVQILSRRSFTMGACFMAILLIKFNIAAMQAVLSLFLLIYSIRYIRFAREMVWMAMGAAVIAAPFIVYFAAVGNLKSFINEYFLLTFQTTDHWTDTSHFIFGYMSLNTLPVAITVFVVTLSGVLMAVRYLSRWRYIPLIAFLIIFTLSLQNATCTYYFCNVAPFLLFLVIGVVLFIDRQTRDTYKVRRIISVLRPVIILMILVLCVYANIEATDKVGNIRWQDNSKKEEYKNITSEMTKKKKPTIVYFSFLDAYDVPCDALPGCKYFARQDGELPEMLEEAREACRNGQPDFVMAKADDNDTHHFLLSCQYKPIKEGRHLGVRLYAKQ